MDKRRKNSSEVEAIHRGAAFRIARRFALVLSLLASSLFVDGESPAGADHLPVTATGLWDIGHMPVEIWFMPDFPSGSKRFRIIDAMNSWDHIPNSNLSYEIVGNYGGPAYDPLYQCANIPDAGYIHYRNFTLYNLDYATQDGRGVPPSAVAFVQHCTYSDGKLGNRSMAFQSNRTWYDGTGNAPDGTGGQCLPEPPDYSCLMDFWSTAAHEFGHMSGFSHFRSDDQYGICNNNSLKHTMCPTEDRGQERWRSLEFHEIAEVQQAY